MKTMRNNKGVALVTVLIGVSFIIILASSLVYMSYMNYITKAVRNATTDNFYTDEFALDDLCMSLQQTVSGTSSAAAAKTTLRSTLGVISNPSGPGLVYNNEAVANLIQVASQESDITVDTRVDTTLSGNYIEEGSSVKLLGVAITSTTEEGYQSTICSDIIISFPNGGLGDLDVNDFSVITDSPISITDGDIFFSGCIFVSNPDPSGYALYVNRANVHILASRGIINGNLIIDNAGFVAITGNVSITGDIIVKGNSSLLCSENVHYRGELKTTEGANIVGFVAGSPVHEPDMNLDSLSSPELADGLAKALFADIYIRSENASDTSGYNNTAWHAVSLEEYNRLLFACYEYRKHDSVTGMTLGMSIGMQYPVNAGDLENSLVLSAVQVKVRDVLSNTTIVSPEPVEFDIGSVPTYMTAMSDAAYDRARDILIPRFMNGMGGMSGNYNNVSGFWDDANYLGKGYDEFPDPAGSGRVFVYNSSNREMYVPVGYFLKDDTSSIITTAFSGLQGNADPGNPILVIENWEKE